MSKLNEGARRDTGERLEFRSAGPRDAVAIAAAIDTWWARHLRHFVHPLFLEHFGDTCVVVEDGGELVAFLVGMLSQRHPGSAYVHFMGVHPDYRRLGLGRELYERFFVLAGERGATVIEAETGAFNAQSIAFHGRLGFTFDRRRRRGRRRAHHPRRARHRRRRRAVLAAPRAARSRRLTVTAPPAAAPAAHAATKPFT